MGDGVAADLWVEAIFWYIPPPSSIIRPRTSCTLEIVSRSVVVSPCPLNAKCTAHTLSLFIVKTKLELCCFLGDSGLDKISKLAVQP